jgi:D-alanyl-D-alanine carboxypeptidase
MKVGIIRSSLIYTLLLSAKTLAFLESKFFDLLLKIALLIFIGYALFLNRLSVEGTYRQARTDIKTLIWYKTLPADYFVKLERESQEISARYYESIKPRPPRKTASITFPELSAKSYIVLDKASSTVLSSNQSATAFPPASTAKLATALAALKIYKLTEEVTVPQFCTQVDGTKAGVLQGQKFLVSELLQALLVYSAGDAGCTLSIGKTSYADFIGLMNQVAKEAGMQNTKFTNPIGLDDVDGQNLASAEDLAKLGILAVGNDLIKQTVRLKEFELKDVEGKYSRKLDSTNKFLTEIPESVGIKTGTTTGAGEVLIYEYAKDKADIVIVVMGSSDRFKDTRSVLDWVLQSYAWDTT